MLEFGTQSCLRNMLVGFLAIFCKSVVSVLSRFHVKRSMVGMLRIEAS